MGRKLGTMAAEIVANEMTKQKTTLEPEKIEKLLKKSAKVMIDLAAKEMKRKQKTKQIDKKSLVKKAGKMAAEIAAKEVEKRESLRASPESKSTSPEAKPDRSMAKKLGKIAIDITAKEIQRRQNP